MNIQWGYFSTVYGHFFTICLAKQKLALFLQIWPNMKKNEALFSHCASGTLLGSGINSFFVVIPVFTFFPLLMKMYQKYIMELSFMVIFINTFSIYRVRGGFIFKVCRGRAKGAILEIFLYIFSKTRRENSFFEKGNGPKKHDFCSKNAKRFQNRQRSLFRICLFVLFLVCSFSDNSSHFFFGVFFPRRKMTNSGAFSNEWIN